jgi:DNA polymerase (family 10)
MRLGRGYRLNHVSRTLLLATALEMARLANEALARAGLDEATVVGEARRGIELVRDLSMIAHGPVSARRMADALREASACEDVGVEGRDVVAMRFEGGGAARVRIAPRSRFVEAVVRGTGSPRHVRWLEGLAEAHGGLAAVCTRARSEAHVYEMLGVPYAPPELREGATHRVPNLVGAVQGVFHVHTTWSDGSASILDMARAAGQAGFAYLGITEHSRTATYARGLDGAALERQSKEVARTRRQCEAAGVRVLHGVEVDVMADGSLDLDDATLASLDFVIASVHDAYDMAAPAMTARLVRAVSHPLVTILGHPTGRLLLGRAGYPFDVDAVAEAAAKNETFLEINANPQRLDLGAALVRQAAARGAKFAIDPDAHTPRGVRDTALGVSVARRAGLAASQVLNARGADEVIHYLAGRKRAGKRRLAIS